MAAGLQVFNRDGTTLLDLSVRHSRITGYAAIRHKNNGSVTVSRSPGEEVFFIVVPVGDTNPLNQLPNFEISGNVISWKYVWPKNHWAYTRKDFDIHYGVA